MRQAGEPSVEEILASIKKVIARDSRGEHEGRSVAAHGEEEILDLADVDEFIDADECDETPPLIDEEAANSISDSLAALAMLAEPPAAPQIVRSGETSLEGLTRELLRPALTEWLDRNLPAIVEKMVAAEIARIVGKRG